MKKLLLLTVMLCLMLKGAQAVDHGAIREAVNRAFPGWKTVDTFDMVISRGMNTGSPVLSKQKEASSTKPSTTVSRIGRRFLLAKG